MLERFFLDRQDAVLLVIDIQERLAAVMEDNIRRLVIDNTLRLAGTAKLLCLPSVLTEQYPKGLGETADPVKSSLSGAMRVEKLTFDCCGEPSFVDGLQAMGRKKVILAGMETHICVLQTCIGLLERGFAVHVAADACCSRRKENHLAGIEFMRDAGAAITTVETALFQLAGRAGTEEFKAISKLIK